MAAGSGVVGSTMLAERRRCAALATPVSTRVHRATAATNALCARANNFICMLGPLQFCDGRRLHWIGCFGHPKGSRTPGGETDSHPPRSPPLLHALALRQ